MSEDSGRAGPEARTETSLFEPLLRIKGVLFVSMVLAICVMALDLSFWFRAILLALVVLGAVWAAAGIGNGEDEKVPLREVASREMAAVSGERLADLLTDPMIVFDHTATVRFANVAALEAFQSLQNGTALYLRFRAPEMLALIQGVIADGEPRNIEYFERVPIDRWYKAMVKALRDGKESRNSSCLFSATRAKHGVSTVCVPTLSPMQAMSCAPRLPRCAASSKRCKARRATMPPPVTAFSTSCRNRPSACRV